VPRRRTTERSGFYRHILSASLALRSLPPPSSLTVPPFLSIVIFLFFHLFFFLTQVDYEVEHRAMFEAVTSSHEFLANYSTKKFKWGLPEDDSSAPPVRLQTLLPKDQTAPSTDATSGGEVPSRKSVEDGDRLALQSCVLYFVSPLYFPNETPNFPPFLASTNGIRADSFSAP